MNKDSYKQHLYDLEYIFDVFKKDMSSKGNEQFFKVFDNQQEQLLNTLYVYYSLCLKESENNE